MDIQNIPSTRATLWGLSIGGILVAGIMAYSYTYGIQPKPKVISSTYHLVQPV